MTNNLYIYGDSIMKGIISDKTSGQYSMYQPEAFEKACADAGFTLVNRSRFGATIDKGKHLIERDLKRIAKERDAGDTITVLLEYGGNDSDFYWDQIAANPYIDHFQKTPPPEFIRQYREIIAMLRGEDIEPIILDLPPIEPHRYHACFSKAFGQEPEAVMPFIGAPSTIYYHQEQYSDIVRDVAREAGLEMIDIRCPFLQNRYCDFRLIGSDGLHPTPEGHDLIRNTVLAYLRENHKNKP